MLVLINLVDKIVSMSFRDVQLEPVPDEVKQAKRTFIRGAGIEVRYVECTPNLFGRRGSYVVMHFECDDGSIAEVVYSKELIHQYEKVHSSEDPIVKFLKQLFSEAER